MEMEFACGGTLSTLMKKYRNRHINDEDCALIMKNILLGLKHIHRHDFVHRDLKPSNIVIGEVDQFNTIKLVDFGLAVKYQTRQGMDESCGTLIYQAPEQMAGG